MTSSTQSYDVLLHTDFPGLQLFASGKVRDLYLVGNDHLLFVATDRISAFDYVLATGIPQKGRVLTQLSLFWFDFLKDIVPNHLATADVHQYPPELQKYAAQLRGRSMLVARADMIAIECVVRGYLSGSGWKEYKTSGEVCGIKLPSGLKESDKLPEPIFTPAIKATSGHDENISFEHMVSLGGPRVEHPAARFEHQDLPDCGRLRRDPRHHHRRYQVRVRPHCRETGPGRRSVDAGLVALLAEGQIQARWSAGFVRQAVCARLPGSHQVEQAAAGAGFASRGGGPDQREVR